MTHESFKHSFFVIECDDDLYFAGYNAKENRPEFTNNPYAAKIFISKAKIKLRPGEAIVEIYANLGPDNCSLSYPFVPSRKVQK
jgi:hypothetical protein